jgi:protein TonB
MRHRMILGIVVGVVLAAGSVAAQERTRETLPTPVKQVKADYTDAAKVAGIQGTVLLEVVVLEDGRTGDVKVTKSLDKEKGLDDQAVAAAKQWEWKPGTRDGKPTPVAVTLEMTFRLR